MSWVSGRLSTTRNRLAHLPKWLRVALLLLGALFMYALPVLNPPIITTAPQTDFGGVLFTVTTYVLVALGLNIVIGYAGLLDLGYVGFYAVGAYTVGVLGSEHASLSWLICLPIAAVVATLSGVLLGAPTLRVRGDYLAIVTLGFGEIIRLTATNANWLGASFGISDIPSPPSIELFSVPHLVWNGGVASIDLSNKSSFLTFGVVDSVPYYWLGLTIVLLVLFADRRIKDSRVGRAWEATREDEDAAEVMGVPTFKFKLLAFAMGAFIGGVSGALYAPYNGFISPISFQLILSILFVSAVIIGGAGNRWGVIVGAIAVSYLPERFREFADYRVLVFGIALILLAIFRSQGLLPPRRTVRARKTAPKASTVEAGAFDG
jgi:branched-chain amino acid transport system permease protein